MKEAGLDPDPWQTRLLESHDPQSLLLCARQTGKSTVVAAMALQTALTTQPGQPGTVLLLSPTLRQSGELFRDKVLRLYDTLSCPLPATAQTQLSLELANGGRIISLPDSEAGIRGYSSVVLLIIDEAARVSEELYRAVRPMLAVSKGRLLALSTPFGKRGWYYEVYTEGGDAWQRYRVTADECPRISPEFLVEERRALGELWYRQEYECSFEDAEGAVFLQRDIDRAFQNDRRPLFPDRQ
jgi:hypothetical protein